MVNVEAAMKALARRVKGMFSLTALTAIGISATWSQALGQSTPDNVSVPEPASITLFAAGLAGWAVVRKMRNRQ
jgi:PEP-CTERM motif-containing protein